ncbi:MAG: YIEGIA domain-containing protein, partial [Thermoanaerobacteraceae bacterium]|nr:YIEGIA domain-containing protein [Thermoanaerobacteraceae bacterium]
MQEYLGTIIAGTLAGTLARLVMLHVDYRQYPGYPHGYLSHLSLGFIAASLGAVAVPAILKPDFTAVTFLSLAASQFREIRNIERKTLENLEENELVKRGSDYIEGIARTFEARNYLVMATALLTSIAHELGRWPAALLLAALAILFARSFKAGETIGDICEVLPARLWFNEDGVLMVEDIGFVNIGLKEMREKIETEGLAVLIRPKNADARATIHDLGQRQAMAHTVAVLLGSKKDVDLPEYTPLARKNPETGEVGLYTVPVEKDMDALILAVKRTPVLESARSRPLKTEAGRLAAR